MLHYNSNEVARLITSSRHAFITTAALLLRHWESGLQVSRLTGYRETDGDISQLQNFGRDFCKVGGVSDVMLCFMQQNTTVAPSL